MKEQWNLMNNWNLIIPPSRPSFNQLNEIVKLSSGIDREKPVAVLGSTPEYRDLLHELSFKNIYVFDNNRFFFDLISKSRIYQNNENFIFGNWAETLENFKDFFSLIVSDLTSGNVLYTMREKFYSDIENALAYGGYFFDKILTHNENFLKLSNLLIKYEKLPLNLVTVNYFSCEFLFCSELLIENRTVDTCRFYSNIEKSTNNARIHKFVELSKKITPADFIWYYGKSWRELKQMYCINLHLLYKIDDEFESPYFGFVKIFCFKKKKNYEKNKS